MKKMNKLSKPIVSVIIPVFNGASYLEQAVYSVLNSSYKNIEVLLIDDGSKDHSKHLCRKLARKYKNVRFYSFAKNQGLGRVLNFAIKKAQGKFICRINQDDLMLRHRIGIQLKFLKENPEVVAVGSYIRLFDNKGNEQIVKFLQLDETIKKVWHVVSPFADPSVMYRKAVALKVGGYKQEFWPADDTHLWIRMGMVGKLANIDKALVEVRYHRNAASVRYFKKLTLVTYKMHQWMNVYVKRATLPVQIFWVFQLIAGLALSPDLNWKIYRILKRMIYSFSVFAAFLRRMKIIPEPITKKAIPHPIALSRSGQ